MLRQCHETYKHSLHPPIPVTSSRRKRQKCADIDRSVSVIHQSVMASSPKKSRLGPSPEDHASLQTTEAGGSSAKEDTKYDMKKLMERLKKTGTKEEYKRVPAGLRDLINRLCKKFQVKHAVWAQSADWREVKILGRGATGILEELRESAKSEFPEYRFIAVESGPSHTTKLCTSFSPPLQVVAVHPNPTNPEMSTENCEVGELILKGRPKTDETVNVYIGCPAHGVLTDEQCDELKTRDIHCIKKIRQQVKDNPPAYALRAQLNNNDQADFALPGPPLICYRRVYTNGETCAIKRCEGDALPNCPHMYENDIALLQLDGDTVDQLREGLGDKFHPYHDIIHFACEHIDNLIDLKIPAYIKGAKCYLVPALTAVREEKEKQKQEAERPLVTEVTDKKEDEGEQGGHIRFVVPNGVKLKKGNSGSVLYIKDKGKHLVFAMLVGKLASEDVETEYIAILLRRALDDIEADYELKYVDLFKPATTPGELQEDR